MVAGWSLMENPTSYFSPRTSTLVLLTSLLPQHYLPVGIEANEDEDENGKGHK
jgi:hypothetical protein